MKNDATEAALGLLNLADAAASYSTMTVPSKRAAPQDDEPPPASTTSDSINCICGYTFDDGFSIACDDCSRWCHAACFGIVAGGVPEEWKCWVCAPRPVDRDRAVRLQTQRKQDAIRADNEKRRRQASPGVDRKHRRQSALAIEGGNSRRKRRASVNVHLTGAAEDEHVNVEEPWTHSYIPIAKDVVPHQDTRDNLRRQAKHWRGVSALSHPYPSSSPFNTSPVVLSASPSPSQTSIRPLPHSSFSHPILSSNTNPSVRPPSYSVHTTHPVSSSKFITPYTSTIIPSSAYLSDPLNAYAHHGMPKPFVHLFGPPLDVALDARITGNQARFVRSGCRPNAVLRPMVCPRAKENSERNDPPQCDRDREMLTFGVFALRDIKANEEVVLGWEWDDGNAVHHLPALIETPHLFEAHHVDHIRNQMASMLHALSSTFTTCACGSKAKDCALTLMAEFVDGRLPAPAAASSPQASEPSGAEHLPPTVNLGPLVGVQRGFRTREKSPLNGGMNGVEMIPSPSTVLSDRRNTVESPVVSTNGYHHLAPDHIDNGVPELRVISATASPSPKKGQKEKGRGQDRASPAHAHRRRVTLDAPPYRSPSPSDSDPQPGSEDEDQMPPKMRKRWIHRSTEGQHAASPSPSPSGSNISLGSVMDEGQMEVDTVTLNTKEMPPPPMPADLDPTTISSIPHPPSPRVFTGKLSSSSLPTLPNTQVPDVHASPSPSTPFANLSLLSPTASYSSNSSPLSPKLSTLIPPFLSMTSTSSPDSNLLRGPMPMVVDKDAHDSDLTPRSPSCDVRSPSPQSLATSEPLRRVQSPPHPLVESPRPVSPPQEASSPAEPLPAAEPPPSDSPLLPASLPPVLPPVPKVKMSLKDFAMRKKKQREEELARAVAQSPELLHGSEQLEAAAPSADSLFDAVPEAEGNEGVGESLGLEASAPENLGAVPATDEIVDSPASPEPMVDEAEPSEAARPDGSSPQSPVAATTEPARAGIPDKAQAMQEYVEVDADDAKAAINGTSHSRSADLRPSPSPRSSRTPSPSPADSEDGESPRSLLPTQPRSFLPTGAATGPSSTGALPHRLPPSSTYRPGSSYVPPSVPAAVRPLPSGPRALRAGMGQPGSARFPAAQFAGVPRGPSADRDRDRGWAGAAVRGRGRGTASSWGR
ncbi:hypothetical protein BC834DRAFT_971881 [Gloeopeniophorella convolvens]|nr:hypothetical protein BC834DRAFT_971881 [Gloeopeniophorella convolvens]